MLRLDPVSLKIPKINALYRNRVGAVASWLVRSTQDLDSGSGRGLCVVFQTLYSLSTSLHPGVQMGAGEFNAGQ